MRPPSLAPLRLPAYRRLLSAYAVNNLGDRDLFQQRYRALLAHYGLKPQAIQARKANQNGDVEQSHYRFKTVVDQALLLGVPGGAVEGISGVARIAMVLRYWA